MKQNRVMHSNSKPKKTEGLQLTGSQVNLNHRQESPRSCSSLPRCPNVRRRCSQQRPMSADIPERSTTSADSAGRSRAFGSSAHSLCDHEPHFCSTAKPFWSGSQYRGSTGSLNCLASRRCHPDVEYVPGREDPFRHAYTSQSAQLLQTLLREPWRSESSEESTPEHVRNTTKESNTQLREAEDGSSYQSTKEKDKKTRDVEVDHKFERWFSEKERKDVRFELSDSERSQNVRTQNQCLVDVLSYEEKPQCEDNFTENSGREHVQAQRIEVDLSWLEPEVLERRRKMAPSCEVSGCRDETTHRFNADLNEGSNYGGSFDSFNRSEDIWSYRNGERNVENGVLTDKTGRNSSEPVSNLDNSKESVRNLLEENNLVNAYEETNLNHKRVATSAVDSSKASMISSNVKNITQFKNFKPGDKVVASCQKNDVKCKSSLVSSGLGTRDKKTTATVKLNVPMISKNVDRVAKITDFKSGDKIAVSPSGSRGDKDVESKSGQVSFNFRADVKDLYNRNESEVAETAASGLNVNGSKNVQNCDTFRQGTKNVQNYDTSHFQQETKNVQNCDTSHFHQETKNVHNCDTFRQETKNDQNRDTSEFPLSLRTAVQPVNGKEKQNVHFSDVGDDPTSVRVHNANEKIYPSYDIANKVEDGGSTKASPRETTYEDLVSILNVLESDETQPLLEVISTSSTRRSPVPDSSNCKQVNEIFNYLEQVERCSEPVNVKPLLRPSNSSTTTVPVDMLNSSSVPRLEDLLCRNTVDLAQEVLGLRLQAEEQANGIRLLQQTISDLKASAQETKDSLRAEMEKASNEAETTLLRHQKMVKQLLAEKKGLNDKIASLVAEMKTTEERHQRNLKTLEERHLVELQRVKETQAAAERLKREKWIDVKTQKIKEMTVKGLEPELSRMAARQQQELSELRALHRAELEAVELRAARFTQS